MFRYLLTLAVQFPVLPRPLVDRVKCVLAGQPLYLPVFAARAVGSLRAFFAGRIIRVSAGFFPPVPGLLPALILQPVPSGADVAVSFTVIHKITVVKPSRFFRPGLRLRHKARHSLRFAGGDVQ